MPSMCDDPHLTEQQILSHLSHRVAEFYRRYLPPQNRGQDLKLKTLAELIWLAENNGIKHAGTMGQEDLLSAILKRFSTLEKDLIRKRAADCTFAFEVHLREYLASVAEWSKDLPQLPQPLRGEGYTQTDPSKNRVHLIKELEQVAAFLLDNLERRPDQPLECEKLEDRQLLSVYACLELAHRASGSFAVMAPARAPEVQDRTSLSEFRMLGWNSEENDVHRIKRAFTAAARDPSIKMHGLKQLYDRLHPETAQRLTAASIGFEMPVPIEPFVAAMDRAAMENLALCLKLAARDLETAFGLWNRKTDPRRHKAVTDFEKPAPFYQFVTAILEQGWPCFDVAIHENE